MGTRWLVGSPPSYVHLIPESPIAPAYAAELFRSALARAGGSDYSEEIHDLLRGSHDPWGQATEAVNRSLQSPAALRLLAQIRQIESGGSLSLGDEDHDEDAGTDEDEDNYAEPTRTDDLFDLWFALVTQPAYVERIGVQMGIAWTGSQAFQAGAFW